MADHVEALSVEALDVSVVYGFRSAAEADLVRILGHDRLSGARLPSVTWHAQTAAPGPVDIRIEVDDVGDDLVVQYSGAIRTPRYRVDKPGFHWDFTKVLAAVVIPRLLARNVLVLHAATVTRNGIGVLLPGSSGAGKSSVAFAARGLGADVPASELSFLRDGVLVAGNSRMTVDAAAVDRFGLPAFDSADQEGYRVLLPTSASDAPAAVTRLLFPRVCAGTLAVRPITARRARMLLFENAVSQLPISQLVAHETFPLGAAPTRTELDLVAQQIEKLSQLSPVIVEGSPDEVARFALAQ